MANLNIISDNAANRGNISATSTAGALVPANLLDDGRSSLWRAANTLATLHLVFPSVELIGGVALPFCNLTAGAMIRVIGYGAAGQTVFDTGKVPACAYAPLDQFGRDRGASDFADGGGACASAWFEHALVRSLAIELADADNPDGYIEASRLFAGSYWSPHYNADDGAALSYIGMRHRKLLLRLEQLPPAERLRLKAALRGNRMARPVFVRLFPEAGHVLPGSRSQVLPLQPATRSGGFFYPSNIQEPLWQNQPVPPPASQSRPAPSP
ncbi:hypothetical protein [Janthinobacterium agaricidamnosum]|uniref:Uncharacterized protein n=1 Tax=Janthinobacterium agaricidamnosum NBRC 102515 = DSM 9628 TaxID=1349767 RepID=W0V4A7_9BURK|nr:hypothetical protein [Janthinobacterium agaricidamnosum]CDG82097.1 hypothetical protein GJA_1446 [Janthinobacterium agaricidamnosum NBRC 102515 = DSM 9628]